MQEQETVLGILPGACPTARTILLMRRCAAGRSTVCLQNETFSEAVGWFTQGSVELSPEQVGQLKSLIGGSPAPRKATFHPTEAVATLPFTAMQAG